MFSDRLKALRAELGFTQAQLTKDIETKQGVKLATQTYSTYENSREPSYDILRAIAKYFNVTADYLLGLSDAREPQNAMIVKELGLTESSIAMLKQFRQEDARTNITPNDTRTQLDVFNSLLSDAVFSFDFITLLGALTYSDLSDAPPVKLPDVYVYSKNNDLPTESILRFLLEDDLNKIIDNLRFWNRKKTASEE